MGRLMALYQRESLLRIKALHNDRGTALDEIQCVVVQGRGVIQRCGRKIDSLRIESIICPGKFERVWRVQINIFRRAKNPLGLSRRA